MTQPSKFIYDSDYATTTNDAQTKFTITVPSSFTLPSTQPFYVINQEFTIGEKAASMRVTMRSSKNGKTIPCVGNFAIPATFYSTVLGQDIPTTLNGWIYRSAPGKVCVKIIPNYGAVAQAGDVYRDCGQTLTFAVSTFLNPFET